MSAHINDSKPVPATLKTFAFTLVLSGIAELTVEMADALYEAGCDDATPGSCNGIVSIDFDREAESLGKAIGSAIVEVERAGFAVARVEVGNSCINKSAYL